MARSRRGRKETPEEICKETTHRRRRKCSKEPRGSEGAASEREKGEGRPLDRVPDPDAGSAHRREFPEGGEREGRRRRRNDYKFDWWRQEGRSVFVEHSASTRSRRRRRSRRIEEGEAKELDADGAVDAPGALGPQRKRSESLRAPRGTGSRSGSEKTGGRGTRETRALLLYIQELYIRIHREQLHASFLLASGLERTIPGNDERKFSLRPLSRRATKAFVCTGKTELPHLATRPPLRPAILASPLPFPLRFLCVNFLLLLLPVARRSPRSSLEGRKKSDSILLAAGRGWDPSGPASSPLPGEASRSSRQPDVVRLNTRQGKLQISGQFGHRVDELAGAQRVFIGRFSSSASSLKDLCFNYGILKVAPRTSREEFPEARAGIKRAPPGCYVLPRGGFSSEEKKFTTRTSKKSTHRLWN